MYRGLAVCVRRLLKATFEFSNTPVLEHEYVGDTNAKATQTNIKHARVQIITRHSHPEECKPKEPNRHYKNSRAHNCHLS